MPKQKIICKCFFRFSESERHLQMIYFLQNSAMQKASPLGRGVIACDDGEGKEVDREAHT